MKKEKNKDKVMRFALGLLVVVTTLFAIALVFAGRKSSILNQNQIGFFNVQETINKDRRGTVNINGNLISVSIADSPESTTKGLSGVLSMPQNEGKFFIFTEESQYSFWMKDMNFPIDIIWINRNNTIVDIHKNIYPETYPATFSPAFPALMVLEVNAGYVDNHNIGIGDSVTLVDF